MKSGRDLFDLDGRTAVITGGSRGLGLQIAEALGSFGARVLLSARHVEELESARRYLEERDIEALCFASDVADPNGVARLADEAVARLGRVDILVNNAGKSCSVPAEEHPIERWDSVFAANVRGLFLITQAIAKRSMIPQAYGRIINVASVAALRGNPPGTIYTAAYSSSKGAVVSLTRALAAEWGQYNITVNALAPGFFPSRMTQRVIARLGEERLMGNSPLRRLGDDQDLKGATLLFASDAGKHITGQVLAVDGGYTAV